MQDAQCSREGMEVVGRVMRPQTNGVTRQGKRSVGAHYSLDSRIQLLHCVFHLYSCLLDIVLDAVKQGPLVDDQALEFPKQIRELGNRVRDVGELPRALCVCLIGLIYLGGKGLLLSLALWARSDGRDMGVRRTGRGTYSEAEVIVHSSVKV